MPSRPVFNVGVQIKEVTDGLSAGTSYVAQNTGPFGIFYCTSTTEPTNRTNISWHLVGSYEWMQFDGSTTNKVWVRSAGGLTRLSISEA